MAAEPDPLSPASEAALMVMVGLMMEPDWWASPSRVRWLSTRYGPFDLHEAHRIAAGPPTGNVCDITRAAADVLMGAYELAAAMQRRSAGGG